MGFALSKPQEDPNRSGEQDKLQDNSEDFAGHIFMDSRDGERAENDYQGAD
jgi:hypothetical protein